MNSNSTTYAIEFGTIGTTTPEIAGEYLSQHDARVEAAERAFNIMDVLDTSVTKPHADSYVATDADGQVYFWRVVSVTHADALNSAVPAPTPEPAPATDNPDADFARWEGELVAMDISHTINRLIDRADFCADMPGASDDIKRQMAALISALTAAKQLADTL